MQSYRIQVLVTLSLLCPWAGPSIDAASLTCEIHWDQIQGDILPTLFSMNLFSFPIVDRVSNPTYREKVRYLKPVILRLHNAGTTRDRGGARLIDTEKRDWDYDKIKTILTALQDVPGERMFNIVHFPPWMDTDDDQLLDKDKVEIFVKFCADLVRFTNKKLSGTTIKYWEVTNERDRRYGDAGRIHELADIYNRACLAMKAVDPKIKVGGPAFERPDIKANARGFIDASYQNLDFISAHGYACGSTKTPDHAVYDKVARLVGHMTELRDYCRTKTDRHIPIYWDEFNISWTWRSWDGRMKNNKGACFDALCYIEAIQAGLDGLFPWNECDGIYGKMGNKFELRPPAHCIHLLASHVKGQWVETVDTPEVRLLATRSGEQRTIVLVNRSNEAHTMALNFTGDPTLIAGSTSFIHHSINGSGLSKSAVTWADLNNGLTLPRHSVHVLVLQKTPVQAVTQVEAPILY